MNFTAELREAYQKTIAHLYGKVLKPFYTSPGMLKDLLGLEEFMAAVEHAVEVNKETVVDMSTFQFNYKLWIVATQ